MRRTLEIVAGYSGKIPMGNYENESPLFSLKEVIEYDETQFNTDDWIALRQKELKDICYTQFKHQAELAKMERITNEQKSMRFYDGKDGLKYPSVTSIIGWDKDFHMTQDELAQYAARGTIIDKQVQIFLDTQEWKEPKDIPEIYPELVIVKKGLLALELDNVDFPAFYKEYPFKVISQQTTVINHELRYGGRMEIECIIESTNKGKWEKIEGVLFDVPTLLDVKATTSLDKLYVMKQCTAYAKCKPEIQQIGAIHLKKDNKQGYAKPILETNLDKYWTLFVRDRELFQARFGV